MKSNPLTSIDNNPNKSFNLVPRISITSWFLKLIFSNPFSSPLGLSLYLSQNSYEMNVNHIFLQRLELK